MEREVDEDLRHLGQLPTQGTVDPVHVARELGVVVQIHHQVSRLLGHPGAIRVGAHPDPKDPTRSDVYEHQHV
jgi:hypothetical protein